MKLNTGTQYIPRPAKGSLCILALVAILGSVFFFSSVASASTNSSSANASCDRRGGSTTCTVQVSTGDHQAWEGNFSGHLEGHGASGPSGGKGGVSMCISPSAQMWASGASCTHLIDPQGNGDIGDGNRDFNLNHYIGGDLYSALGWVVAEIYVNDATFSPATVTGNGRKISIDSFNVPGSVAVGQSIDIDWSVDDGWGADPGDAVELEWSGAIGGGSSLEPKAGARSFSTSSSGVADFILTARGPSSSGKISISRNAQTQITGSSSSPPGGFNFSASCTGGSTPQVAMSWSSSSGASSYRVERRIWSTGSWSSIGTTGGTSFSDTGPVQTADNYYRIYAVNTDGETISFPSEITLNVTPGNCGGSPPTPPPPPPPTPGPTTPPPPGPQPCDVANNSTFITWSTPPSTMAPGEARTVSVTMRNIGTTTWDYNSGFHRLGSQNPQDNANWSFNRVDLPPAPYSVLPGADHVFTFPISAPTTPGSYNFQWRMIKESAPGCWFGQATPNFAVQVVAGLQASPGKPTVSGLPACSNGPYAATLSWTPGAGPNPSFGYYVDVATNNAFAIDNFYNKNIPYSGGSTPNSTGIPSGFTLYDDGSPALTLNPGVAYYARSFNGYPDLNAHSETSDPWYVPLCSLQVNVRATPGSGTAPLAATIGADVSGSGLGTIVYDFDCNDGGSTIDGSVATTALSAGHVCTYTAAGTYYPNVTVTNKANDLTATDPTPPAVVVSSVVAGPSVDLVYDGLDAPTVAFNSNGTLSWTVTNANSCSASSSDGDFSGLKNASGGSEAKGPISTTRTYTLDCTGPGGSGIDSVTVTVSGAPLAPSVDLTYDGSDNPTVPFNSTGSLAWSVANADSCSASSSDGDFGGSKDSSGGSEPKGPITTSRTYTLSCTGPGGSGIDSVSVTVGAGPSAPSVDLTYDGSDGPTVPYNSSGTLAWSVSNADSCIASSTAGDFSGSKSVNGGSESKGPLVTTRTYTLDCTSPGGSGSDSVTVTVSAPPPPNLSDVTVVEPDYCSSGPNAIVSWTLSEPQSAYQLQIDTDAAFGSPDIDTGKLANTGTSYVTPNGTLDFNRTYRARVRAWNLSDTVSSWTFMSQCFGPGCNPGDTSWNTPVNPYPTADFSYTPARPARGAAMQFTDLSTFYGPLSGRSWLWNFGDGTTSTAQNPTKSYPTAGDYTVCLTVTDSAGQSCSSSPCTSLTVQKAIPEWREVLPR